MALQREDYKYHIIKKFIIRLDFQELFESDITDAVRAVREYFVAREFKVKSIAQRNIHINLNDNNNPDNDVDISSDTISQPLIQLSKDEVEISISRTTLILNVKANEKYKRFEAYHLLLEPIIKTLTEQYGDFLQLDRLGLRKVNQIFVLNNIETVKKLFNPNLLSCCELYKTISPEGSELLSNNVSLIVKRGEIGSNINASIQSGTCSVEEKPTVAHLVVLDFDAFIDRKSDCNLDFSPDWIFKSIVNLNNEVFYQYSHAISDEFNDFLQGKNEGYATQNGIIGVTENEMQDEFYSKQ